MATEMTNRQFAKENELFNLACIKAGVAVTVRQASKFRLKKGSAYRALPSVGRGDDA